MNARWMLTIGLVVALAACGSDTQPPEGEAAAEEEQAAAAATEPAQDEMPEAEPPAPETMSVRTEEPEETEEPAEPEPPAPRYDRLYTVQIAAYLDEAGANRLADRLRDRGLPIWVTNATVGDQGWTRVRIGASPSLTETRELGAWITRQFDSPVWVAPVDQTTEPVPGDAVEQTRAFLQSR